MHFNSKKWNDLLFEGRNKAYGAFKLRAGSSRRHLLSFLIVVAVLAGGLFLYQWINSLYFENSSIIDNAMPPISETEMEQSLDLQEYAKQQVNPVIQNQPVVGDISQSAQQSNNENAGTTEASQQQLDDILKHTIEEQMLKAAQEPLKNEELEPDKIYLVVDVMPQFPGGQQAMTKFLTSIMNYPADAQRRRVQGQVICNFVVDTDGSITDIEVVKKIDPVLDRESVRILKQMPRWLHGERLGKPVRVRFSIPFNFGI